jgi:hypothetical protein
MPAKAGIQIEAAVVRRVKARRAADARRGFLDLRFRGGDKAALQQLT